MKNISLSRLYLILLGFLILINFTKCTPTEVSKSKSQSKYVIGAYIFARGDRLKASTIDAKKLTRIYYAFGDVRNGRIVLGSDTDSYNLRVLDSLRQANPDLKILLSVGGWTGSHNFSNAVLTRSSRKRFVDSGVQLVKKYDLDGIDIDWEYPGQIGDGNIFRPSDKKHFTQAIQLMRKQFTRLSKDYQPNRHFMITIAAGANTKYIQHTDMKKLQKYLDDVNLMTYDYYNGSSDSTGFHTNLYPSPLDIHHKSIENSVDEFIKAGVPARKIIIGAAFYGHGWSGVNPKNNGRYESFNGPTKSYSFDTLQQEYINKNGFIQYWDNTTQAPYLWNPKSRTFISYDSPRSIEAKDQFIKKHHLGGIMFWQYTQDMKGTLLNAIYKDLK